MRLLQYALYLAANVWLSYLTSRHPDGNFEFLTLAAILSLAAGAYWCSVREETSLLTTILTCSTLVATAAASSFFGIKYDSRLEEMGGMLLFIAPFAIALMMLTGCILGSFWQRRRYRGKQDTA